MQKIHPQTDCRARYQIFLHWLAVLLCIALAACQSARVAPPVDDTVAPLSPLPDAPEYVVDSASSELRVMAWREGALSRLGHNHVITAPVHGVVHAGDTAEGSGFALYVNVQDFVVDAPVARAEEGDAFASAVSASARKGTRENLLGEDVLDAKAFPRIALRSVSLSGPRWNPQVTARVTLRGVARNVRFPAAVFQDDDMLVVIATFSILQSEFGITPMSILGGGIRVRDALDVRVRLVARRQ